MDVEAAIQKRRAKRALLAKEIPMESVDKLVEAMRLAPSCNNQQPWRVVIVRSPEKLKTLKETLPRGNVWATRSPTIFAIASKPEDDCRLSDNRDYFLFGCGLSVGIMTLQATELGLIAHPIAGYDPIKAKQILGIPSEYVLITLVICGYPDGDTDLLSEKQKEAEKERPSRKPVVENFFMDEWGKPLA